jgi:plasmid stabilization system protein ParE
MNESFELHPGASKDITEIWQFIAEDNPVAATRFREDILHVIRSAIILSLTRLMRSLSLSSP